MSRDTGAIAKAAAGENIEGDCAFREYAYVVRTWDVGLGGDVAVEAPVGKNIEDDLAFRDCALAV
jgi:hypothetical protein